MADTQRLSFTTPRDGDLGLQRIANGAGLSAAVLPNGALFAIEHEQDKRRILINQVLGSPLQGGIGRLLLRLGGPSPDVIDLTAAATEVGVGQDRIVWAGESGGVRHRATLWLHPTLPVWLWRVEASGAGDLPCDAVLLQDIGLGDRGFLMNNEAFGSQYCDHHVAVSPEIGPVVMSRQNLVQGAGHPWLAHGCLEGAASYATDALQLFGPAFRDAADIALPFGTDLPGTRLQHEVACAAIQSRPASLAGAAAWTFFALFEPDHPAASGDGDLDRLDTVRRALADFAPAEPAMRPAARSLLEDAAPVLARSLDDAALAALFPERRHEERRDGRLLSFFTPDGAHNRHVVLRNKEHLVPRRHGTLLRSGQAMLLDEATLCATAWMHGVFAAQLTIGNTSFHKLFSVSRDPYNITRASGLRILIEIDGRWRLLAVPSAFDIGLSDCRWIYALDDRTVTVGATAAGEHAAMQWQVEVDGPPCRFLVLGHLVLGERELDHASPVAVDPAAKRISMRPDPAWLWGQRYPEAVYHLVTGTPDEIEAVGGAELVQAAGAPFVGSHVALRTRATAAFSVAVVGSMTDAAEAERLAALYEGGVAAAAMLAPAARHWEHVTRGLKLKASGSGRAAAETAEIETLFPWLAHNMTMHLTVPHGLEQYTGAAWGTRDVCQGPIEFLLALEHDAPVKDILRILFAQQYETLGSWPQWFMLEPYSFIQDRHAHGDVIVWPLKALCDYVEATNDLAFLDEPVAWRREDDLTKTERRDSVETHLDKLVDTVTASFIPGTHLVRYGEGDWNDSLQPADAAMRDWMVSSWTVALLFHQLKRYAEVLRRAGRAAKAAAIETLAAAMAADFHRHLMRDGVVAGYGIFGSDGGTPELMLHPSDRRTGLRYSLLPMSRAILAGLFSPEEARRHFAIVAEHLRFPDGVRLMDRPVAYHGGLETFFRRAESSSFFGREIGLMYVHAHLWHVEAAAALGEAEEAWAALGLVNAITVTERLAHAAPRQRNCYFSSSDAAFADRYAASRDWDLVRSGGIAAEGGWRIYSSGPGLFANALIRHILGIRRHYGERIVAPVLPADIAELSVDLTVDGHRRAWDLAGKAS